MVTLYHKNATQPIEVGKEKVQQLKEQGWVTEKPTVKQPKKPIEGK